MLTIAEPAHKMPFTFSHPAAILPLNYLLKKRTSLTALVVGSIVPDFEYFFRVDHRSFFSHTWSGLFWFDVPAGLLLCFVYHTFIRDAFYSHAPHFLKQRMAPYYRLNWNKRFRAHWPQILLCVFIGACSHLLWDKLLHHSAQLIQTMDAYPDRASYEIRKVSYLLFWSLHSLLGAFLVFYALWRMPADKSVPRNTSYAVYWSSIALVATVVFLLQLPNLEPILDNIVIAMINGLFIGCLFTSCLFAFRLRKQKRTVALAAKKQG